MQKKLVIGPKIRRLRRELGLTQAQMADEMGISTAYLNLIERNQRPVTAQFLVKLAEVYAVDMKAFAQSDDDRVMAELREVFSDPLFAGRGIDIQDLRDLANSSPSAADAVTQLYRAYQDAMGKAIDLAERLANHERMSSPDLIRFPLEDVRDFFTARNNHFPELEEAAEELWRTIPLRLHEVYDGLKTFLFQRHGISVRIVPRDMLPSDLRRYDPHSKRILLSEMLPAHGRAFQLAHQLALVGFGELLDTVVAQAGLDTPEARQLCRLGLANYFAGAVLMPYERFLAAAQELRYDIDVLSQRFATSFEQTCHRFTTLQRPGAKGVPFFLIRVDPAGNISKRFSAGGFHFARFGGACPRWNVHEAFRLPGVIMTQIVEMPDGTTYFSIARTVSRTGTGFHMPEQLLAIGLGCEISHARQLVYADSHNLDRPNTTPIGVNCRLCERPDCNHRALPPLSRRLNINEFRRGISQFSFAPDRGEP